MSKDIRTRILRTIIEVGVKGASRESQVLALDAHFVLTGNRLEGAFQEKQLAALYPEFESESAKQETKISALSAGKKPPLCIYFEDDLLAYYEATDEDRQAWNEYAQRSADIFNSDPSLDSYDSTNTVTGRNRVGDITRWCPPMFFPEWLAERRKNKQKGVATGTAA